MADKPDRLDLRTALAEGRLEEFIIQAEADGVRDGNERQFNALIGEAARAPQSEDRTSRSAARGGSRGK